MEESHPNWKRLPAEIIHSILQLAAVDQPIVETCNYALVCKAWTHSAQFLLYSKVAIHSLSQLKKFSNAFEQNTSLGEIVKVLCVHYPQAFLYPRDVESENVEMLNLVTSLLASSYLPNLEEVTDSGLDSYAPLLNGLLKSQLKHLQRLSHPDNSLKKSEIDNYIECALLMKDRIESITILSDTRKGEGSRVQKLQFHHLYNKLHQFENLSEITVKRDTNDEIQAMEYIVEACKSLKSVSFVLTPISRESNSLPVNKGVSIDAISNYIPSRNIKELNTCLYMSNDHKTLTYIMHKFQQLQQLNLSIFENKGINTNRYIFTQLLHYLSGINRYHVFGLPVDPVISTESMGSYWNATSKPGNKYVKISYCPWYKEAQTDLELSKVCPIKGTFTGLSYPLTNLGSMKWLHKYFIKQNGIYIHKLLFTTENMSLHTQETELPEDFFAHTFAFCPNLQYLYLNEFTIKQPPYTMVDFSKKLSLTELYLAHCKIYEGTLDQLSLLLFKIKQLRLGTVWYFLQEEAYSEKDRPLYVISMPHTEIDVILFEEVHRDLYLELFVNDQESQYYYQFNREKCEYDLIGEEVYAKGAKQGHIKICCKNKPDFRYGPPAYLYL